VPRKEPTRKIAMGVDTARVGGSESI